jgi:hypothetical protein
MSQRRHCGTTIQAEAPGVRDQLKIRPAPRRPKPISRKGEGFEKWRPSWISFHHPTSHGLLSCVAPILARDLKKRGGIWDRYNLHFSSVIAWLVIYHVFWLTPFSINWLGLDKSGQNVGIENDVMAHDILVATGRWSWLGMMGSLC